MLPHPLCPSAGRLLCEDSLPSFVYVVRWASAVVPRWRVLTLVNLFHHPQRGILDPCYLVRFPILFKGSSHAVSFVIPCSPAVLPRPSLSLGALRQRIELWLALRATLPDTLTALLRTLSASPLVPLPRTPSCNTSGLSGTIQRRTSRTVYTFQRRDTHGEREYILPCPFATSP